jgi:hypothetical protein
MARPDAPSGLPLGMVVATRGALELLAQSGPLPLLRRHQQGDWGEVGAEDWRANDDAVKHGGRVLSAYTVAGERLWIITEADRSVTTLLLPSEY